MNFLQLKNAFINKALYIETLNDTTAKYRAINYKKVAKIININTSPNDIVNIEKINILPITQHMKEKAVDFMQNKKLITPSIKTDIKTLTFLNLKPIDKIPHEYIKKFEKSIKKISTVNMKLNIVGSYRRKKPYSTDVDIMICSNNKNAIEIFKNKIQSMYETCVYSEGLSRISMIIISDITFKIDAFKTTTAEEIPMLIYSTGSKEFNIFMRSTAKKQGYLLNQKGLFKNSVRINGLKKEEDYFKYLNIKYIKPELR